MPTSMYMLAKIKATTLSQKLILLIDISDDLPGWWCTSIATRSIVQSYTLDGFHATDSVFNQSICLSPPAWATPSSIRFG